VNPLIVPPSLDAPVVHVWRVDLAGVDPSTAVLSIQEQERARRFRRGTDWRRFVARRVALRSILSRYLGVAPGEISFAFAEHGRPRVEGAGLDFNLSTTGDLMVCAVATGRRVGVDVEPITRDVPRDGSTFMSPGERRGVEALPVGEQASAITLAWVRKEALTKAVGTGLRIGLDTVVVPAGKGPILLTDLPPAFGGDTWTLYDIDPAPAVAGAVAVSGDPCAVTPLHWSVERR
jgi:4'-phosphopantetheinyl transferase